MSLAYLARKMAKFRKEFTIQNSIILIQMLIKTADENIICQN